MNHSYLEVVKDKCLAEEATTMLQSGGAGGYDKQNLMLVCSRFQRCQGLGRFLNGEANHSSLEVVCEG